MRRAARDQRPLDGGLGDVGRGQSAGGADPVGAGERHVGEARRRSSRSAQLPTAARVPGRTWPPIRCSVMFGSLGQQPGDRQGVGDDGELAVGGQHLGEPDGGGAGVDDDRAAVGQLVERGLGDPLLLARRSARSGRRRPARCRAARPGSRRRAPGAARRAAPGREVAADGLRRDVEGVGQPVDVDTARRSARGRGWPAAAPVRTCRLRRRRSWCGAGGAVRIGLARRRGAGTPAAPGDAAKSWLPGLICATRDGVLRHN